MKKLTLSFLTLFAAASAFALPLGNPWEASLLCDGICREGHCCTDWCDPSTSWCDAWSVRLGFYGDYVFNQHMEVDDKHDNASIHEVNLDTNAAYFAVNVYDRVDLFVTLGTTNIQIKTPVKAFAVTPLPIPALTNDWVYIESETDFSYSVGARATLWECGCFAIGGEFQYFFTRPKLNFFYDQGEDVQYLFCDRAVFDEWQFGLGAAYRINIAACDRTAVIPYVGIRWGRSTLDMDDGRIFIPGQVTGDDLTARLHDLENERGWGYAFGTTLVGCEKWSVTVEGRWIHEKAVHVNGQIRY